VMVPALERVPPKLLRIPSPPVLDIVMMPEPKLVRVPELRMPKPKPEF